MKNLTCGVALAVFSFASVSFAAKSVAPKTSAENVIVTNARIFEPGTDQKTLLFKVHREEKAEGGQSKITEVITDPQGQEAVRMEANVVGGQLKSYTIDQKQNGAMGKVEVRDGKVYFEYTTADGKKKKDDEKLEGNLVVGLTMRPLVEGHWNELLAGKDVEMRWIVPDRAETVGFKLFKDKETQLNGHDVFVIKMKPTSAFISALVKPLYFYFEKNGKLRQISGRVIPKRKIGDDWKDLDAETVYD